MFRLSFFGPFARQRDELLVAKSFAPIPLHPAVERQLQQANSNFSRKAPRLKRPWNLFWYGLREIKELIVEHILWNAASALIVLGSVFVAREVFQARVGITEGLVLAGSYLLLKIFQATIDYFNGCRRLQIHRGLQIAFYRCINEKLVSISPAGRAEFSKGGLKTLLGSDVESIEDFISAAIQQWIPVTVSTIILVPALYFVSGTIGLLALLVVILLIPVAMIGAAFVEMYQKKAQKEQDELTTIIGEWVKNIRLVRYLGWGKAIESEVEQSMHRFVILGSIRHAIIVVVYAMSMSWPMLPLLSLFWISSLQARPLNLLEVFSSVWILDHLLFQIQHIPYSLSLYGSASAGATRVINLLNQPDLSENNLPAPAEGYVTSHIPSAILVKGITVRYGTFEAIRNLSLEISLSQRTAIVGSVGSGKTTLLETLLGELPLTSGAINIRFENLGDVPLWREDVYKRFRSLAAYSPQQPFLSNATMRNNIDLSATTSSDDINMALLAAQLNEDLATFPRGLEEEVGESGINLSGGQKQRVSLARAFISKRPFLFLDDPLSAVDPRTEGLLMTSIMEHGRGVLLVSHRLAELERCDRVIVLDNGTIVEDGCPKALACDESSRFSRFLRASETHEH